MSSVEGYGSVNWWGFSPAIDLLEVAPPSKDRAACGAINFLLVGCGDLRHVLMTASRARQHTNAPLQFYIIEGRLEILARHMLFLSLLIEPHDKIGLREKTELYLEIYGNTLVRAQTAGYVQDTSNHLIRMITDPEFQAQQIPFLDTSLLKFKERDMMEGIFKFWRMADNKSFDIQHLWDGRLRHYLGSRYDARTGVFDWDYHMKLQELAPTIRSSEYIKWREEGVAFRLREDAPYETPNRTLASGLVLNRGGERVACRGFWGDVVNSPFIAHSTKCANPEMLKKSNDRYVKSGAEISEYNVYALVYHLLTGTEYRHSPHRGNASPATKEVSSRVEELQPLSGPFQNGECNISFLPLNFAEEIGKKAKFQRAFDYAYFSNSMVHHLVEGISTVFANHSVLFCESARFMLDLKEEQKGTYREKVTGMAKKIGFQDLEPIHDPATMLFTKS